jgi:hypothetical protein
VSSAHGCCRWWGTADGHNVHAQVRAWCHSSRPDHAPLP